MLDHVTLRVSDPARSKAFYEAALKPLAISKLMEGPMFAGYGDTRPFFWVSKGEAGGGAHVAFGVADRATVDAFYAAALSAGARDNGPPGVRAHYHPNYYGAFVLDPDGHNIEAVCHAPG